MLNFERQNEIIKIIQADGFAKVESLAKRLYVSAATIRRDLTHMEQIGMIKKVYGGAVIVENRTSSPLLRYNVNTIAKNMIAKLAMPLLTEPECIYFDSSSTTGTLASKFNIPRKTIITIGLQTASTLCSLPETNLFIPGGKINYMTNSISGSVAINDLSRYTIDLALISASAVCPEGISETSIEQSEIKRFIIKHAKRSALLIDSSKFGLKDIFMSAPLDSVNYLITDKKPTEDYFHAAPNVEFIYPKDTETNLS